MLGPAAASRIALYNDNSKCQCAEASSCRLTSGSLPTSDEHVKSGASGSQENLSDLQAPTLGVGWARLTRGHDLRCRSKTLPYEFSSDFFNDASIAFSNQREFRQCIRHQVFESMLSESGPTRLSLNVICATYMILQRQESDILQYDVQLPQWPKNEKQFHAARYRRSQLQTLTTILHSILHQMRILCGADLSWPRDIRVVRLEHILDESPEPLSGDFRAALRAGVGTRNPAKIKANGWVESAFTIWLCGLWILCQPDLIPSHSPSRMSLRRKTCEWIDFLRRAYGQGFEKAGRHDPAEAREDLLLAESYYAIVKRGISK